jgi:hypothetical protein
LCSSDLPTVGISIGMKAALRVAVKMGAAAEARRGDARLEPPSESAASEANHHRL